MGSVVEGRSGLVLERGVGEVGPGGVGGGGGGGAALRATRLLRQPGCLGMTTIGCYKRIREVVLFFVSVY